MLAAGLNRSHPDVDRAVAIGVPGDLLAGLDIVIPGDDAVRIDPGFLQDLTVIEHQVSAQVVVNAVLGTLPLVRRQTRLDQLVAVRVDHGGHVHQMDVTLDERGKAVDFNIDQIWRSYPGEQGCQQVVVHLRPGDDGWNQRDRAVWILFIPAIRLAHPVLGVRIYEGPEGQFSRLLGVDGWHGDQHHQQDYQHGEQLSHFQSPLTEIAAIERRFRFRLTCAPPFPGPHTGASAKGHGSSGSRNTAT